MYGEIKNAYFDKLDDNTFLVYAFSTKYKRTVNTHGCNSKEEAMNTIWDINGTKNSKNR